MDKQAIINELKNIIDDYLKVRGLDLIDLIYRYEGRALILRILADRPEGGITIDECGRINNELSNILDEKDVLQERYILEVFSPGLDRPLSAKGDFLRCIGREVRFFLREPINNKRELEGRIIKVDDESVYVDINGEIIVIAMLKIAKAKQIV